MFIVQFNSKNTELPDQHDSILETFLQMKRKQTKKTKI